MFDQGLAKEITDMKEVYNQMETEVTKCSVERKYFQIEKKELFIENDRLLEHIICQDVMCIAMHADLDNKCVVHANDDNLAYAEMEQSFIDEYSRCVKLEVELSKMNDIVEKDVYNELSKRSLRLEQHCINLEITVQQMKESLRNKKPCNNQDAPEFPEFFEIHELKARLQKKNTIISNLKDHIASLNGKNVFDCIVSVNNSCVITLGMYKLDLKPLSPLHKKNRDAHLDYLKETRKNTDILRDIVEEARDLSPSDNNLGHVCNYVQRIQELLAYVGATCPDSKIESKKVVAAKPMNKQKKVRFKEPKNSTSNTSKQADS
ncbi:hypothetical protein Tco_0848977 [Tanacetum coccineum]